MGCKRFSVWAAVLAVVAAPVGAHAQITFADVYAAPDDQDLNLAYARQQADAGELLGAAAALERMLYGNPDWDSARLFYAGLLVRMDDRQGAERELRLLQTRPLSAEQRAELTRITASLEDTADVSSRELAGLSGQISVAARYDDDAGGVFGDVLFGGGGNEGDESALLQAQLQYTTPLGDAASGFARGELALRRHEDMEAADYSVYGAALGIRGGGGRTVWEAEAGADFVDIAGDDYLDQYGLRLRLGVDVTDTATLSAVARWHDQDFQDFPANPAGRQRSGDLWELGPRLDWRPSDALRLRANILYQDKSARSDVLAYDGVKLDADALLQLSADTYLRGYGVWRDLSYDAESPFVFPAAARSDQILRLRGALGVRASAFAAGLPLASDITVEFAVNHLERDTNIAGGDFSSTGAEIRLVYGF